MHQLISFKSVSKNYGNEVIIDNVSFSLDQGSITTLVGPNGAGKTTIARLILDIEKPTSGTIIRSSRKYSYIPQKIAFDSNIPLDVSSLVKYLARSNVKDVANTTGFAQLNELANKQISTLSGGQLQKVLLATAILSKPQLIVLDEPTQGLDIKAQEELYLLLSEIRKQFDIAIFMISHDLHTVMQNSDKVLCLNHHICCSGKPESGAIVSQIGLYTHHHNHTHEPLDYL